MDALPNGAQPNVILTSVSCPQINLCVGVGVTGVNDEATSKGIAEQFVEGVWHEMALPSGTSGLDSVSCVAPTWCMAIGSESGTVAIRWNGTTWNGVKLAPRTSATTGADPSLDAVSCISIDFCMAVGATESTPLAEAWNGTAWTVTTARPKNLTQDYEAFSAVSCPSASLCLAVGADSGCCGQSYGIAMAWNGSSWNTPIRALASEASPGGISCTSATSCLVVGTLSPSDTESFPARAVVEHWNGTNWTSIPFTFVGRTSSLNAVSCSRANWCAAVGSFTTGARVQRLAERWNGAKLNRMWVA